MRRLSLLLLTLLGCFIQLHAQQNNKAIATWYKQFKGNIGTYPVTFHLFCSDTNISGYYYYDQVQRPLAVNGIAKGNTWTLSATGLAASDDAATERMAGTFSSQTFNGTWKLNDKSLPMAITQEPDSLFDSYVVVSGSRKRRKAAGDDEFSRRTIDFDASAPWSSRTDATARFVKQQIAAAFDLPLPKTTLGEALLAKRNAWLHENQGPDAPFLAEATSITVAVRNAHLLSLSHGYYTDGGGAHGMYTEQVINLDLDHLRRLTLADVLDSAAAALPMQRMLEAHYRKDYKVPAGESLEGSLLVDTIPMSSHFYISGTGLLFVYPPYDIGPYAAGTIYIFVPYKQMAAWLRPRFANWIKTF